MKLHITLLLSLFSYSSYAQNEADGRFSFLGGLKTRVTPIYVKHVPDFVFTPLLSDLEQPDMHLSGPGLELTERVALGTNYSLAIHQVVRYDYMYQTISLDDPPPPDFNYKKNRRVIYDFYFDIARNIAAKKSFWRFFLGAAVCGLNTKYIETIRTSITPPAYKERKKDFIFPAATTGIEWQKRKFYTELKFGYCWNNPTFFDTPFIFPEISLQYQILRSHKKND
jgi:hypothetical protein